MTGNRVPGRAVRALYRLLLRSFPTGFRERYGAEMEAFFEAEWRSTRPWARPRLLLRTLMATPMHGARECRADRRINGRGGGMGSWMNEIGLALRGLSRRPGFAAVAIGTVALGIGAAVTVFTVVDHVVLRPLPYDEPDELVSLWTTFDNAGDTPFGMSLAVQYDFAEDSRVIESMGGFGLGEATWTGRGDATRIPVIWFRGEPFRVTGIGAAMGRLPTAEDQETGATPVAVVTHHFWRTALAEDPEVVGRTLELDGSTVEIVGVLEPGAALPAVRAGVWRPQARSRADIQDRSGHWMDVLARLRPGQTVETLRAEVDRIHGEWRVRFAGEHSPGHPGHDIRVGEAQEWYFGELRATGRLLLGAVGLLLLLACANVAALLLARGEGRMGEFAIRRALGASRGGLARALLLESGTIAFLGAAVGVALAIVGTRGVLALAPPGLPRLDQVTVDGRVLLFTVGLSLLSGLLFGTLPAMRGGSARPGTRGATGPGRGLSRSLATLVTVQLSLAVILLTGAGLLTRSVQGMLGHETGIEAAGRLTAKIAIPQASYPEGPDVLGFWEELDGELEAIEEIEGVAMSRSLPLADGLRYEGARGFDVSAEEEDAGAVTIAAQSVSHDWFQVAGIPVQEGRGFLPTDRRESEFVAVLNREAAERYFPGKSPVGRTIQPLWVTPDAGRARVVGVVGDVTHDGVREGIYPQLYLVMSQAPLNEIPSLRSVAVVARTSGDPGTLAPRVREVVRRLDPAVPVQELRSWEAVIEDSVVTERFIATLVTVFASLALILAGLGTYGLVAFTTARRTREVGVRMALGAEPGRVAVEVVRRTTVLAALGLAVGVAGAAVAGPLLERFLFGVAPHDPTSIALAVGALGAVTLIAAAVPALRASAVDPTEALRADE